MSDEEAKVEVVDRRGKAAAEENGREPLMTPSMEFRPAGTPVLFTCRTCKGDVSEAVLVTQMMLPAPGPNGMLQFVPQTIYLTPIICPKCKQPQVFNSSIAVPQRS